MRRRPLRSCGARGVCCVAALLGVFAGLMFVPARAAEPLRVGLLLSPEEAFRESLRQGAQLAVSRFNATSSQPLELVIRGRPGQWGDDADEAGRLVLDDAVRVLISPPGAVATHLALQVAGRTRTPVIALCPDASVSGAGIPWMVRLVPTTAAELKCLAGPGRWQLLAPAGRPARELEREADRLRAAAAAAGTNTLLTVVPIEPEGVTDASIERQSRALAAERPDGVLLWLDPQPAARRLRALRTAGFAGPTGGCGWLRSPVFLDAAGEAARGFRVAAMLREDRGPTPTTAELDAAGLVAFDAVGLAAEALRRAGERPFGQVLGPGDFGTGATGPWRFDRTGNREVRLGVRVWDGGAWRAGE